MWWSDLKIISNNSSFKYNKDSALECLLLDDLLKPPYIRSMKLRVKEVVLFTNVLHKYDYVWHLYEVQYIRALINTNAFGSGSR